MELFNVPEALFQPKLFKDLNHEQGIHEAALATVIQCDDSIHKDLISNIILSGGPCMIKGFAERLQTSIAGIAGEELSKHVNISSTVLGSEEPYVGACAYKDKIVGDMWIEQQEFEDIGPSIAWKRGS